MSNMGNAANTAAQGKSLTIFEKIQNHKEKFELALPSGFGVDRFLSLTLLAVSNNKKLQQCKHQSVIEAMMSAAAMGLEPNSPLHEAAIIPYKDTATFQPEYRGLLKMAWNSGLISSISYNKVCENDAFEYEEGIDQIFKFRRELRKARGDAYAYYAFAHLKDGGTAFVIKSKEEIIAHAKRFSKAWKKADSPWHTDFDSMAIKTVLIELSDKKLPRRTTNEAIRFHGAIAALSTGDLEESRLSGLDLAESMEESVEIKADAKVVDPPEPTAEEREQRDEDFEEATGKSPIEPAEDPVKPEPEEVPEALKSHLPKKEVVDPLPEEPEHIAEMDFMGDKAYTTMVTDLCEKCFNVGGKPATILRDLTGNIAVVTNISTETKKGVIAKLEAELKNLTVE